MSSSASPPASPGSFVIRVNASTNTTVCVGASDSRGLQAATGRLLRELHMPPRPGAPGSLQSSPFVSLPASLDVHHDAAAAELWAVRGHQIPTSHHPFQFRTLVEFQQFARDLAAFGTNRLELGHVALPLNVSNLVDFADACAAAGISVSVWGGGDTYSRNYSAAVEVRRSVGRLVCRLS